MSHVVVAPDKFKGTLTAAQVAAHVAAGLGRACPGVETVQVPVADGGDGTVDAAEAAGYRRIDIGVRGPTGKPVTPRSPCSTGPPSSSRRRPAG
jgi:Glycerate kinase